MRCRGPQEDIQWKTENMWMVNTGASLKVLDGKGSIDLGVNDIFKGIKFAFNGKPLFVQNGQLNWESRTAYLVLTTDLEVGKIKQNNVEVEIIIQKKEMLVFKTGFFCDKIKNPKRIASDFLFVCIFT